MTGEERRKGLVGLSQGKDGSGSSPVLRHNQERERRPGTRTGTGQWDGRLQSGPLGPLSYPLFHNSTIKSDLGGLSAFQGVWMWA